MLSNGARAAVVLSVLLVTSPFERAAAQGSTSRPDSTELARRIDALARELEDLKLGPVAAPPESRHGFGPAASKVYSAANGVSFGGYGEMLVQSPKGETASIDLLRQILYVGYKFDEHLLFNSEIEFEHASTELKGSVSVEFGYLDALVRPAFNVRAGLVLVPMGFLNELHEPPIFLGTHRPETERRIVPSTWRANGVGVFGAPAGGWTYRAYLMESLRSVGGTGENAGFDPEEGLRDGRQNGSEALFENVAGTLRVDWQGAGALVGGSAFRGGTAQGATTPTNQAFDATTTVWEAHAQLRRAGLRLRGLVAGADVQDAAAINAVRGFTGDESVGSNLLGWYAEAGYEVWSRLHPGSRYEIVPYLRYEALDTQREVPAGFARNRANDATSTTAGAAFFPHPQVVVKGDYQWNSNDADTGVDQWNCAVGFLF